MRWRDRRRSAHVEDRRGRRVSRPVAVGGLGGVGLLVVLGLGLLLGIDPIALLSDPAIQSLPAGSSPAPGPTHGPAGSRADDERAAFVSVVLADTEETWHPLFRELGGRYQEPTLVLFEQAVRSACGTTGATVGPFYCPADRKVYIDLGFYDDLRERFRAPGDFAQAYVIAHEVGHHVQNLLGVMREVDTARRGASRAEANELSVRLELQADCLAGVWAHHADRVRGIVEPGDIAEALGAASAIGDDRIQRRTQGHVVPESFTHGSAEQRVRWFRQGYEAGDPGRCDTFSVRQP